MSGKKQEFNETSFLVEGNNSTSMQKEQNNIVKSNGKGSGYVQKEVQELQLQNNLANKGEEEYGGQLENDGESMESKSQKTIVEINHEDVMSRPQNNPRIKTKNESHENSDQDSFSSSESWWNCSSSKIKSEQMIVSNTRRNGMYELDIKNNLNDKKNEDKKKKRDIFLENHEQSIVQLKEKYIVGEQIKKLCLAAAKLLTASEETQGQQQQSYFNSQEYLQQEKEEENKRNVRHNKRRGATVKLQNDKLNKSRNQSNGVDDNQLEKAEQIEDGEDEEGGEMNKKSEGKDSEDNLESFQREEQDRVNVFEIENPSMQDKSIQRFLVNTMPKKTKSQKEKIVIQKVLEKIGLFEKQKEIIFSNQRTNLAFFSNIAIEHFQKHDVIFNVGEFGNKYYIVVSGGVHLLLPSMNGKEQGHTEEENGSIYVKFNKNMQKGVLIRNQQISTENLMDVKEIKEKVLKSKFCLKIKNAWKSKQSKVTVRSITLMFGGIDEQRKHLLSAWFLEGQEFARYFFPNTVLHKTFISGEAFGEIALLTKQRRTATMVSLADTYCISLSKQGFDKVIGVYQRGIIQQQLNFLTQFSFFEKIPKSKILSILHDMKSIDCIKNQIIFKEGDPTDFFYLVKEGDIQISQLQKFAKETNQILQRPFTAVNGRILDKGMFQIPLNSNRGGGKGSLSPSKKSIIPKDSQRMFLSKDNSALQSPRNQLNFSQKLKSERDTIKRIPLIILSANKFFGQTEILRKQPYRMSRAVCTSLNAKIFTIPKRILIHHLENWNGLVELQQIDQQVINYTGQRIQQAIQLAQRDIITSTTSIFAYSSPKSSPQKQEQLFGYILNDSLLGQSNEVFSVQTDNSRICHSPSNILDSMLLSKKSSTCSQKMTPDRSPEIKHLMKIPPIDNFKDEINIRNRAISIFTNSSRSQKSSQVDKTQKLNKSQTVDISEKLRNIGKENEDDKEVIQSQQQSPSMFSRLKKQLPQIDSNYDEVEVPFLTGICPTITPIYSQEERYNFTEKYGEYQEQEENNMLCQELSLDNNKKISKTLAKSMEPPKKMKYSSHDIQENIQNLRDQNRINNQNNIARINQRINAIRRGVSEEKTQRNSINKSEQYEQNSQVDRQQDVDGFKQKMENLGFFFNNAKNTRRNRNKPNNNNTERGIYVTKQFIQDSTKLSHQFLPQLPSNASLTPERIIVKSDRKKIKKDIIAQNPRIIADIFQNYKKQDSLIQKQQVSDRKNGRIIENDQEQDEDHQINQNITSLPQNHDNASYRSRSEKLLQNNDKTARLEQFIAQTPKMVCEQMQNVLSFKEVFLKILSRSPNAQHSCFFDVHCTHTERGNEPITIENLVDQKFKNKMKMSHRNSCETIQKTKCESEQFKRKRLTKEEHIEGSVLATETVVDQINNKNNLCRSSSGQDKTSRNASLPEITENPQNIISFMRNPLASKLQKLFNKPNYFHNSKNHDNNISHNISCQDKYQNNSNQSMPSTPLEHVLRLSDNSLQSTNNINLGRQKSPSEQQLSQKSHQIHPTMHSSSPHNHSQLLVSPLQPSPISSLLTPLSQISEFPLLSKQDYSLKLSSSALLLSKRNSRPYNNYTNHQNPNSSNNESCNIINNVITNNFPVRMNTSKEKKNMEEFKQGISSEKLKEHSLSPISARILSKHSQHLPSPSYRQNELFGKSDKLSQIQKYYLRRDFLRNQQPQSKQIISETITKIPQNINITNFQQQKNFQGAGLNTNTSNNNCQILRKIGLTSIHTSDKPA